MACEFCNSQKAVLIDAQTRKKICKQCFIDNFENRIYKTVQESDMFLPSETIAIGVSGGKDSTVLAHVLNTINAKYNLGLNLVLLCIDEGIKGYRDNSIAKVLKLEQDLALPLTILSFQSLFNTTMDDLPDKKNSCSYCGKYRREALLIGAKQLNATCIVTGHNANDIAETLLLNFFRGDINRLKSCTLSRSRNTGVVKTKPFKYIFQKEIVMYALYKDLKYFSTECIYSVNAFRGSMRSYICHLEKLNSNYILNLIKSGDDFIEQQVQPLE